MIRLGLQPKWTWIAKALRPVGLKQYPSPCSPSSSIPARKWARIFIMKPKKWFWAQADLIPHGKPPSIFFCHYRPSVLKVDTAIVFLSPFEERSTSLTTRIAHAKYVSGWFFLFLAHPRTPARVLKSLFHLLSVLSVGLSNVHPNLNDSNWTGKYLPKCVITSVR